jgi:hypothetical protein
MSDDERFEMLYCDNVHCRVNTFERGVAGRCPRCHDVGLPLNGPAQRYGGVDENAKHVPGSEG